MASYIPPTLTGYNANPPPDDGSQSGLNEVAWDKHIDKIGDPLKDFSEAIDSATDTAFTTVDADIAVLQSDVNVIENQILTDSAKYDEDTGVANAYVVTLDPAISSYVEGHMFRMKIGAGNTNTGACTVTINGVTPAQSIKTQDGGDPAANDLLAGGIYAFVYDGTNYQIQRYEPDANTATVHASGTLAYSGPSTTTTWTHGLGTTPLIVNVFLINDIAEGGYSPGDIVSLNHTLSESDSGAGPNNDGIAVQVSSTAVTVRVSPRGAFTLTTTYGNLNVTTANWSMLIRVVI